MAANPEEGRQAPTAAVLYRKQSQQVAQPLERKDKPRTLKWQTKLTLYLNSNLAVSHCQGQGEGDEEANCWGDLWAHACAE